MKKIRTPLLLSLILGISCFSLDLKAQSTERNQSLSEKQQTLIPIVAYTAIGDLQNLKPALNNGLDAGLTINEIKESMVHLYAYAGFPRSIRGLNTFMEVLDEREADGIQDEEGPEASPINDGRDKYDRGVETLYELTGSNWGKPESGYGAFSPAIDTFLKEHLFADLFERDVISYDQRQLTTISVLSSLDGVEPMLGSHFNISLNVGLTPGQLQEFVSIIESTLGEERGDVAQAVLNQVLENRNSEHYNMTSILPEGNEVTGGNFTGTVWVNMIILPNDHLNTNGGKVKFEPKARSYWHTHPGGQILIVTDGTGYHQIEGKPIQIIREGDVIKVPPGAKHWHGASHEHSMTHTAIGPNLDKGGVEWAEPVSDEEYDSLH